MFTALNFFIGVCLALSSSPASVDELLQSLDYSGISFRRAPGLPDSIPHHQRPKDDRGTTSQIYALPSNSHLSSGRLPRKAVREFSQGQHGYSNASAVDQKANQYWTNVVLNGVTMKLLIDSGSSDTWVRGRNFTCSTNNTNTGSSCGLGPAYPEPDFPDGPIDGQHFYISPSDSETVAGLLGYMDVEIAGITVHKQETGLAGVGSWNGDNVTSGVLGLAYPSLTSAYIGDDNLTAHDPAELTTYSPLSRP